MGKRRIMRSFRIDEISAVDRPAQEGATALIMKRDGGAAPAGDADPHAIMREVEDGMDRLADLLKRDGETAAGALSRLVRERHPLMMSMARNRDAAHGLAVAKLNPSPGSGPFGTAAKRDSPDPAVARIEKALDGLAAAHAERHGLTHAQAYAEVCGTDEGRRLYAEHSAAADAASRRP